MLPQYMEKDKIFQKTWRRMHTTQYMKENSTPMIE